MARASVRACASIALVALFALGTAPGGPPAVAGAQAAPAADLEGAPIQLVDVGRWFCHDLDWPQLHCFRTQAALDGAVQAHVAAARARTSFPRAATLPPPSGPYVEVFHDISYGGSSAYFAQAYSDLSVIGWNDSISSFKGQAGSASGHFAVNAGDAGSHDGFTSTSQVSYVGDAWNDTFSSVYPVP